MVAICVGVSTFIALTSTGSAVDGADDSAAAGAAAAVGGLGALPRRKVPPPRHIVSKDLNQAANRSQFGNAEKL